MTLSDQELAVLKAAANGYDSSGTARHLHLSPGHVTKLRRQARKKLLALTITEAAVKAVRRGLL